MNLFSTQEYCEDLEAVYDSISRIHLFQGKTILITGAGGMIGSFLADFFLYCAEKKGLACQVIGTGRDVCRLEQRFKGAAREKKICLARFELGEPFCQCGESIESPDYIIHCAGSGSPSEFMKYPEKLIRDTVVGVYELLEYAEKVGTTSCILASSGEVYGKGGPKVCSFTEEYSGKIDHLSPRACYPEAKRAAECLWSSYGSRSGMKTVITRLCHIYGPTAKEEESRIAGICLNLAVRGENVVLKSKGEQRRSWCYVADCASGMLTALLEGNTKEAYNVAPREEATIAQLAGKTAALSGKRVVFDLTAEDDTKNFNPMERSVLSSEKLRSLGWREHYTLDQGLERTYRIMKQAVKNP